MKKKNLLLGSPSVEVRHGQAGRQKEEGQAGWAGLGWGVCSVIGKNKNKAGRRQGGREKGRQGQARNLSPSRRRGRRKRQAWWQAWRLVAGRKAGRQAGRSGLPLVVGQAGLLFCRGVQIVTWEGGGRLQAVAWPIQLTGRAGAGRNTSDEAGAGRRAGGRRQGRGRQGRLSLIYLLVLACVLSCDHVCLGDNKIIMDYKIGNY